MPSPTKVEAHRKSARDRKKLSDERLLTSSSARLSLFLGRRAPCQRAGARSHAATEDPAGAVAIGASGFGVMTLPTGFYP